MVDEDSIVADYSRFCELELGEALKDKKSGLGDGEELDLSSILGLRGRFLDEASRILIKCWENGGRPSHELKRLLAEIAVGNMQIYLKHLSNTLLDFTIQDRMNFRAASEAKHKLGKSNTGKVELSIKGID
jgi:hypothetical protein